MPNMEPADSHTTPFSGSPTAIATSCDLDFDLASFLDDAVWSNIQTPDHSQHEKPLAKGGASSGTLSMARRKPIPRKGHSKSRRGCFGCKRRKIKCSELKPQCENCSKADSRCEYPRLPDHALSLAAPMAALQTSPTLFTMSDMRFFHHFIVRAYPHLPVGADHTWTMEIPAMAHQVGFPPEWDIRLLSQGSTSISLRRC